MSPAAQEWWTAGPGKAGLRRRQRRQARRLRRV